MLNHLRDMRNIKFICSWCATHVVVMIVKDSNVENQAISDSFESSEFMGEKWIHPNLDSNPAKDSNQSAKNDHKTIYFSSRRLVFTLSNSKIDRPLSNIF